MQKTIKLYDRDAELASFDACVVSCEEKDKKYIAVLDATAFFPEEGGQCCDGGTLSGNTVTHVKISDGVIYHTLNVPLEVGSTVHGEIDRDIRFRNMQNHSGEHIVSGLIFSRYGMNNVGFHLGKDDVTMDYDGVLDEKMLSDIEKQANFAVYEDIPIITEYPPEEKLKSLTYRSKIELTENVRIVTIPGYDVCACCAPHVSSTGKIGVIRLYAAEKYKGGTRVHMHAGYDAYMQYKNNSEQISMISRLLSVKPDDAATAVEKLAADNKAAHDALTVLQTKLCRSFAENIAPTKENILVFCDGITSSGLRTAANILCGKCALCALFCRSGSGFSFIAASTEKSAKAFMNAMSEKLSVKGGGSDGMVQGTCTSSEKEIKEFFSCPTYSI